MNSATDIVAPRMRSLQSLEKTLKRLDLSWKVIETTARVISSQESAGFVATLEFTRAAFCQLAGEIVEQIAQTHIQNCGNDLASRAQVAIDILVRNLYERTADVGFIATDGPLLAYVLQPDPLAAPGLIARLTEYRNKYTVYDDILVLDASAQVLLSLKPRESQRTAPPPWWQQAMANSGYVECYGPSDLFKNAGNVLLYVHCIVSAAGEVCGAVVLKFDLLSELQSIFKALQRQGIVLQVLDAQGQLVASNDEAGFGPSAPVRIASRQAETPQLLSHRGEDYLFAHCQARGYQGYAGPGWSALALVRLDEAFDGVTGRDASDPKEHGAQAIDIALDNAKLNDIIGRARAIEKDLNRVIWNGKLKESEMGSGSALNPVFAEIGRTSVQTIAAFDDAIVELKKLLIVGKSTELASHAALAIGIMDRNLYERANDCRWWALSDEFADILLAMQAGPAEGAAQRAVEILAHLNNLYTVYQRVALFDRQGRLLAVSRDPQNLPPDALIPTELLQQCLGLSGTQSYAVSSMLAHPLADNLPTYLFCAPIRKQGREPALGGIALAFNCQRELESMLKDSLPMGTPVQGFFVDQDGKVLASTTEEIAVGDLPEFTARLDAAESMQDASTLCQWKGKPYLLGLANSAGYREFKVSDGYRAVVRAVLLTAVHPGQDESNKVSLPTTLNPLSQHYGIVQCGRHLFALSSAHVVEAVSTVHMAAPSAGSGLAGMLQYACDGQMAVLPVIDSCQLTGQAHAADISQSVVVVLRSARQTIALLVDRLVDVVASDTLALPPGGIKPEAPWICGFIHDNQTHTEPIFALDPNGMLPAE